HVGGRLVVHSHPDAAPGTAPPADRDVQAVGRQARGGGRRPASSVGRRIDRCLANALPRRMHDEDLVADKKSELDDRQQEQGDEWQSEGQLDSSLALALPSLAKTLAHFTLPVRLLTTASSSLPMRLVCVAQPTMSSATAAAPSSTSAYSAVAWPRSS